MAAQLKKLKPHQALHARNNKIKKTYRTGNPFFYINKYMSDVQISFYNETPTIFIARRPKSIFD